ncbi:MAG: hypothetical protein IPO52_10305 [Gemmatimonadetes bacterium]|nr:hypothetical protein [Gemmatimonadota bacterium]
MTVVQITQYAEEPEALEALYRRDPALFNRSFAEAFRAAPQSPVLRAWQARLNYREPSDQAATRRGVMMVILLALISGAAVRLPALALTVDWYYPRFAPMIVILGLCTYFWIANPDRRRIILGLGVALNTGIYVSLLPGFKDSVVMALIHLPILFWGVLGLAFTGSAWRDTDARIRFIRYNGEMVILVALVGLGGMVFSGLTVALFEMVMKDSAEQYFENIGIFGVAAVPVVATYLYDVVFRRRTGIPAVLARVFAPLFLVMSTIYLGVAFLGGQNPFLDRSFLITCNGLLLVVLAITVFSIVERDADSPTGIVDTINVALAGVTLVINAIALSAIVFRLASYGFTPNRVAVLGVNLVIMVHLARICWSYLGVVRGRASFATMRPVVAGYLPVYAVWAALVTFLLPVVFRFA